NILDALDRLALNEDTLVVYVSDHGEQMGAHGLWGKSTFFRESTRVPLLMRWPGQLESGQRVTQPVSLVDLGSTLLQLAGLETLPNAHSEGFGDLITSASKNNPEAPVIIEGFFGDVPGRTVVTSRWRFSCYLNQGEELFDLRSDPTETRNLSGNPAYASIQAELARIAASGWNPEDLQARMKMRMKELSLLQSWVGTTPLKEPDPPWHQGRQLRNYVRV
ncbi:MAG: sulfatase-like hydrolase/transferase, partial [Verrucomicrobiae bacterium]|nr:sulfatase-like hydrolase/transferase [Verrucomicrobiae bacterium]